MTEPFDKTSELPACPPAVPAPAAPLEHYAHQQPNPAALPPRDVAYPPRPIPPTHPYPAAPQTAPNMPPYRVAPHPAQQGYAMPPGYPMPIIAVTQNNGVGAGPIVVRRGTNHGLHVVLTLLTCGLWLPVWIILAVLEAMNRN